MDVLGSHSVQLISIIKVHVSRGNSESLWSRQNQNHIPIKNTMPYGTLARLRPDGSKRRELTSHPTSLGSQRARRGPMRELTNLQEERTCNKVLPCRPYDDTR
jgi:hypothetical protein